jgi:hypothetical protein
MHQAVSASWSGYHLIGPKLPLKLKKIWAARIRLQMEAGVPDRLWSLDDVITKIDELAPAQKPRGPYKKRVDENSN